MPKMSKEVYQEAVRALVLAARAYADESNCQCPHTGGGASHQAAVAKRRGELRSALMPFADDEPEK